MGKRLTYRKSGDKSKVVNHHWETICECLPKPGYAERYEVTVNEMLCAWNETFGKGLDVTTRLPASLIHQRADIHTYLVDGKEFHSIESVEKYATSIGKRIILTQTKTGSNVYLVTLMK